MFEVRVRKKNISDDDLIADLQRVAALTMNSTLTTREYMDAGQFGTGVYVRAFGSWMIALEKAGLGKTFNRNVTSDKLLENLARIWVETGKQPSYHTLAKSNSDYASSTYVERFSSWNQALLAFQTWADEGSIPVDSSEASAATIMKTPRTISWRLRAKVLMRDGATCQMCGASPQSGARLHVDHIHPWSKGGPTSLDNLRILCVQCNIGKGDLLPESGEPK
jgi:hypothetical protein